MSDQRPFVRILNTRRYGQVLLIVRDGSADRKATPNDKLIIEWQALDLQACRIEFMYEPDADDVYSMLADSTADIIEALILDIVGEDSALERATKPAERHTEQPIH